MFEVACQTGRLASSLSAAKIIVVTRRNASIMLDVHISVVHGLFARSQGSIKWGSQQIFLRLASGSSTDQEVLPGLGCPPNGKISTKKFDRSFDSYQRVSQPLGKQAGKRTRVDVDRHRHDHTRVQDRQDYKRRHDGQEQMRRDRCGSEN